MNRLWGNLLLPLAFSATTCAVIAADGEPVSESTETVETIETTVTVLTATDMADTLYPATQSADAIDQYLSVIKQQEAGNGVYYHGLGETLLGLGLAYQNLGRHAEALDVLQRSLHISRINDGLYNESQLPILELIIETNSAISDLEALEQNYHYLYWVNRRNFGDDDPRLLSVIDKIGQWYLNAYQLTPSVQTFGFLLNANELYQHAVAITETHYGPNDERLLSPLYGLVLANHQIHTYILNSNGYEDRSHKLNAGYRMREIKEENDALDRMSANSYRAGKNAMQRIVEIYADNPQISTGSHAQAMVHLGDWYLLYNRQTNAMNSYKMAYKLFDQNGASAEEIDRLLGRPQRLPSLQLPASPDTEESTQGGDYVVAAFDVTKSGRARNIRIIESNPVDSDQLQRRTKKTIRTTRFRPRFEDGNPVATADVNMRYVYHD